MKTVLISIRPEWVERIIRGEKLWEIRRRIPKCELPCKYVIYCTKDLSYKVVNKNLEQLNGKVCAEFILNKYTHIDIKDPYICLDLQQTSWDYVCKKTCLTSKQLMDYIGYGDEDSYSRGYALHIDSLKVYDKPKELSEFVNNKALSYDDWHFGIYSGGRGAKGNYDSYLNIFRLKRPPQSWCYVEEWGYDKM